VVPAKVWLVPGRKVKCAYRNPLLPTDGNGHHYMHATQLSRCHRVALAPTMIDYSPHIHGHRSKHLLIEVTCGAKLALGLDDL